MKFNNILEINSWDQVIRARSANYPNLRCNIVNYNGDSLTGKKLIIYDTNTNDVYFSTFVYINNSTIVPDTCAMEQADVINVLGKYGFYIVPTTPYYLNEKVLTILKGLDARGFLYVYAMYKNRDMGGKSYTDKKRFIVASEHIYYPKELNDFILKDIEVISDSPQFVMDDFDWVLPNRSYHISEIIQNGYVDNGLLT